MNRYKRSIITFLFFEVFFFIYLSINFLIYFLRYKHESFTSLITSLNIYSDYITAPLIYFLTITIISSFILAKPQLTKLMLLALFIDVLYIIWGIFSYYNFIKFFYTITNAMFYKPQGLVMPKEIFWNPLLILFTILIYVVPAVTNFIILINIQYKDKENRL